MPKTKLDQRNNRYGQPPEVYTEIELGLALIQADQSADCGAGGR